MPLALVVVAQTAQTGILMLLLKLVGLRHLTDSKLKPLHICTYCPTTLR